MTAKKKSGVLTKLKVDKSYLACEHHKYMIMGIALATGTRGMVDASFQRVEVLLVGLGGGGLPSYMQCHLPQVHMDIVEIDEAIVSIATDWFDLDLTSSGLTLHIGDGLDFIRTAASRGQHYDAVMLDVDNKDCSSGLSVPPPEFLREDILSCIHKMITPHGVFIVNLVCRDLTMKGAIYERLQAIFGRIAGKSIPEEVNEVIYAHSLECEIERDLLVSRSLQLTKHLRLSETIQDWLEELHIKNDRNP